MAQAVKLCQECGQTSGFVDDRCRCGADLTGVPPTVQGLQNADAQPESPDDAAAEAITFEGDPQALAGARSELANAPSAPPLEPAPAATSPSNESLVLELVADPRVRFKVRSGQTVGRGRDADVQLTGFQIPDDISRVHAEFEHRPTGWFVRHVGHTNFIQVEGRQHRDPSAQLPLSDGAVLMLTATPFVVRLDH